jgi:hypothetical protein
MLLGCEICAKFAPHFVAFADRYELLQSDRCTLPLVA